MQKNISLNVLPSEAATPSALHNVLAKACGVTNESLTGFNLVRQSIDARGKQPRISLTAQVFIDEPFVETPALQLDYPSVSEAHRRVIVVGAGPAGLFAALRLIQLGLKPIVLERGKDIRARRRDLAAINKEGVVNPESNYCFGEGGAGTYSDGKLYTRSTKRGDVSRILSILVHFGATNRILYEAHPHIGTNKLPQIITAMRDRIIACGGEVHFESKVAGLLLNNATVTGVQLASGETIKGEAVILATGHSARDIFLMLHEQKVRIEAKPFALGVRIEHSQSLIDTIQYHCDSRGEFLPPASYGVVQQVSGKGVFSFCMCPGGIIAPAATSPGEIVVNGWSPSKRNNPYANSGIVVSVEEKDVAAFAKYGPLAALRFQQDVEQKAFIAGGGGQVAPAQRMEDYTRNRVSTSLPECSYLPGIHSAALGEVLPPFIHSALQTAFKEFGKKMKGYFTNEAVIVAPESRTSSPVRIPRDKDTHMHPEVKGLYPCGEGAGYAGGIVSAAMDGERIADTIAQVLHR